MRLASCRPTVVFPEPGKPTQAIRCGFEFNGLKIVSDWGDRLKALSGQRASVNRKMESITVDSRGYRNTLKAKSENPASLRCPALAPA